MIFYEDYPDYIAEEWEYYEFLDQEAIFWESVEPDFNPSIPVDEKMSELRRYEIKRTMDQMREGLTFARKMAGEDDDPKTKIMVDYVTSFAGAFIDLLGGMASDLEKLTEQMETTQKALEKYEVELVEKREVLGLDDPDEPLNDA